MFGRNEKIVHAMVFHLMMLSPTTIPIEASSTTYHTFLCDYPKERRVQLARHFQHILEELVAKLILVLRRFSRKITLFQRDYTWVESLEKCSIFALYATRYVTEVMMGKAMEEYMAT